MSAVAIESGKRKVARVPLGAATSACAPRSRPRRQHPPLAPLGRRPLRPRQRPRTRPPPRDPHPRPRLEPCALALLAGPHPLRPRPPRGLQQHVLVTFPPPSAPGPTWLPPSGWLGAAVTETAARRAERAALIGHHRCCLDQPPGEGLKRLPPLEGLVKTSLSRRVVRCRLSLKPPIGWVGEVDFVGSVG